MSYIKPRWRDLLKEHNGIPPMVTIRVFENHLGKRLEAGVPFTHDNPETMRVLYEQRWIGPAPPPDPKSSPQPDRQEHAEIAAGPAPKRRR